MNSEERRVSNDAIGLTGLRPLAIALVLAVAAGSAVGILGWTSRGSLLVLHTGPARWVQTFEFESQRELVFDRVTRSGPGLWVAIAVVVAHLAFTLGVSLLSTKAPETVDGKLHVVCFRGAPPRWSWAYAAAAAVAMGCWLVTPSRETVVLSLGAQTMVALVIALTARAGVSWFSWLRQVACVRFENGVGVLQVDGRTILLSSLYVSGRSLLCVGQGTQVLVRMAGGFARPRWRPTANLLATHVEGPYRGHEGEDEAMAHHASPPPWDLGGDTIRWIVGGAALTAWVLVAVNVQIDGLPSASLSWVGLGLLLLITLVLAVPATVSLGIYLPSPRLRTRSWLWSMAPTTDRSSTWVPGVAQQSRRNGYNAAVDRGYPPLAHLITVAASLAGLVALAACLMSGIWLLLAWGWVMACGLIAAAVFASELERRVLLSFRDGALRVCVHDVWLPVTGVGARAGAAVLSVGPLEIAVHEVGHFAETPEFHERSRSRLSPACAPWSEFEVSSEVAPRG